MNSAAGYQKGHASRAVLIAAFGRRGGRPLFPAAVAPLSPHLGIPNCPSVVFLKLIGKAKTGGVQGRRAPRTSFIGEPGRFF
jgi:hypothetical protein